MVDVQRRTACLLGVPLALRRPEAVLKQELPDTPWLACDANMCPEDFENSLWFQRELMHVVVPKVASTCRSKGPKGEWTERTNDYVIASGSLKGKFRRWRRLRFSTT